MLFIVCSAIPLYQLQFWATEVISFCIGGSEEQRYVRPRAAYLSNANRLDLSKSHWNHITYSSSAKYLLNEEGVKTGETNISVFFLSPHGQTPFYPLTFVFAWQRVRPSDCWFSRVSVRMWPGQWASWQNSLPVPLLQLWNRHGASVITSIITGTQHKATETGKARIEGTQNGTYEIYFQLWQIEREWGSHRERWEWWEERGWKGRWEVKTVLGFLLLW